MSKASLVLVPESELRRDLDCVWGYRGRSSKLSPVFKEAVDKWKSEYNTNKANHKAYVRKMFMKEIFDKGCRIFDEHGTVDASFFGGSSGEQEVKAFVQVTDEEELAHRIGRFLRLQRPKKKSPTKVVVAFIPESSKKPRLTEPKAQTKPPPPQPEEPVPAPTKLAPSASHTLVKQDIIDGQIEKMFESIVLETGSVVENLAPLDPAIPDGPVDEDVDLDDSLELLQDFVSIMSWDDNNNVDTMEATCMESPLAFDIHLAAKSLLADDCISELTDDHGFDATSVSNDSDCKKRKFLELCDGSVEPTIPSSVAKHCRATANQSSVVSRSTLSEPSIMAHLAGIEKKLVDLQKENEGLRKEVEEQTRENKDLRDRVSLLEFEQELGRHPALEDPNFAGSTWGM